jgi:signal peptidase I
VRQEGDIVGRIVTRRPLWQEVALLLVVVAVLSFVLQTFAARVYLIPSESMEPTLWGHDGRGDRIVVEKLSYDVGSPRPGDVVVFKGPSESWNDGHGSSRSSNPVVRALENAGAVFGLARPDENDLVKRVIAVGGQTVRCCDAGGRVTVDGTPLRESYVVANHGSVEDISPGAEPGLGDFPLPASVSACSAADVFRRYRCFGPVTVPAGMLWVMGDNRGHSGDSRAHQDDRYHGMVPVSDVRGKAVFRIWPLSRIGVIGARDPRR